MKRAIIAFCTGLVFGLGLVVSQMVDPRRVLGFLDVTGTWDPTLAFVMGGALAVTFAGYRWVLRRPAPVLGGRFLLPTRNDIDARLVSGAALFGAGWGLSGYCPGPGFAALTLGGAPTMVFVVCMLAGMWLAKTVRQSTATAHPVRA